MFALPSSMNFNTLIFPLKIIFCFCLHCYNMEKHYRNNSLVFCIILLESSLSLSQSHDRSIPVKNLGGRHIANLLCVHHTNWQCYKWTLTFTRTSFPTSVSLHFSQNCLENVMTIPTYQQFFLSRWSHL